MPGCFPQWGPLSVENRAARRRNPETAVWKCRPDSGEIRTGRTGKTVFLEQRTEKEEPPPGGSSFLMI